MAVNCEYGEKGCLLYASDLGELEDWDGSCGGVRCPLISDIDWELRQRLVAPNILEVDEI